MNPDQRWLRLQRYFTTIPDLGISLDISRMKFDGSFPAGLDERTASALAAMEALERGTDDQVEGVFHILEHLTSKPDSAVVREPGSTPFDAV